MFSFNFTRTLPKPLLSYGKYVGMLHGRLFSTKILIKCSCKYACFSLVTLILSVCLTCSFHTRLCSHLLYINLRLDPTRDWRLLAHAESLSLPVAFTGLQGTQYLTGLSPESRQQQAFSKTNQIFWSKGHTVTGQYFVWWIFRHLD